MGDNKALILDSKITDKKFYRELSAGGSIS
jgi:hypothetical protein